MRNRVARIALAAALCCAGLPAFAAGLPDYGSKNFVPGGGTPAFFSNETAAPTVRSDDWSAVDAVTGPERSAPAPAHAAAASSHRHGKVAANHRAGGAHAAGKSAGAHASRVAAARSVKPKRTASAGHTAHARPAASGSRTSGHAKTSRHAAARSAQHRG